MGVLLRSEDVSTEIVGVIERFPHRIVEQIDDHDVAQVDSKSEVLNWLPER